MTESNDLPRAVQSSWHGFLETYEPLRPELYRYCRKLTRSPWDAEDLTQDTLARAFVTLAQLGTAPPNPRAWLFRVASNLWIDRIRHHARERVAAPAAEPSSDAGDPRSAREAAGTLLGQLSPQERAAVVLKDAFGFSLEETAETLSTSVGAIKAALHRARSKLVELPPEPSAAPAPAVLDAFCVAFNRADLDGLTALLLDSASVEVVGATTRYGQKAARETVLQGMLFGVKRMASLRDPQFQGVVLRAPRVEAHAHRGGWVLLHWYLHDDGVEAVRALTRVEPADTRIARLQNYFYNPDLLAEVCAELRVPARHNGYRWWGLSPVSTP